MQASVDPFYSWTQTHYPPAKQKGPAAQASALQQFHCGLLYNARAQVVVRARRFTVISRHILADSNRGQVLCAARWRHSCVTRLGATHAFGSIRLQIKLLSLSPGTILKTAVINGGCYSFLCEGKFLSTCHSVVGKTATVEQFYGIWTRQAEEDSVHLHSPCSQCLTQRSSSVFMIMNMGGLVDPFSVGTSCRRTVRRRDGETLNRSGRDRASSIRPRGETGVCRHRWLRRCSTVIRTATRSTGTTAVPCPQG